MKVVFCTFDTSNYINGPNAWLRRLLPELQALGIQSKVLFVPLAPEWECTTIASLRREGFECLVIPEPHYTEARVRRILEKVAEISPDIFVPNFMVPAFYASRWVREAGIPTVGILHSDDDYYRGVMSEFVFGEHKYQLSAIVCVSQLLQQTVHQQQPQGTLVQRIPYGAPLPQLVASKPMEKLRLAYVGRLAQEQKRIIETTSALCRVVREVPNTEVTIYGSGPDEAIVEQIVQREGRGLPIHLAGRVDSEAMQAHLLNCHGLVLLSDYEGLPVALMEAMACGVVPVCLDIRSGIPELVEDGVTGLLVRDRGDDFVAAIWRLRFEPELWQQLSQQARAKIKAEYSHQACAAGWEQFFQELHQAAGPRRPIKIPSRLNLPPVAPIFKGHDCREPSISDKFLHKSRMFVGSVKKRMLSGGRNEDTHLLKL